MALVLFAGCANVEEPAADGAPAACAKDGEPVTLGTSDARIGDLALDDNYAYWTTGTAVADSPPSGGTVMRVALAGGAPETIASDQPLPSDLAVDAHTVYWLDRFTRQLVSAPSSGGTPLVLADTGQASALAIDAAYAYWLDFDSASAVMKAPLTGGPAVELATTQLHTGTLAIDSSSAYWTDSDGNGTVRLMKVPLTGGPTTTLLTTTSDSAYDAGDAFGLDATSAYLVGVTRPVIGSETGYGSALFKIPLTGGTPTTLASDASGSFGTSAVAVSAADVYWLSTDAGASSSTLMKISREGGAPTAVASNLGVLNIASTRSQVCWTATAPTYSVTCLDTCH